MSLLDSVIARGRRWFGRAAAPPPACAHNTLIVAGNQWYAPAVAGASTFAPAVVAPATVRQALAVLERLSSDVYLEFVTTFYRTGLDRHGDAWRYGDLNTALIALASGLRPQRYLEIGVRP